MSTAKNYVYRFGQQQTDGNKNMKSMLGGKGANLAEMCTIGIPVPAGFTITTEACNHYLNNDLKQWPDGLKEQIFASLEYVEKEMGLQFGADENPLLVSVRSGAAVSMPGMMDTILNLGMNENVIQALITKTKNPRFVYDSYRRFIDMFGNVVMGIDHDPFEQALEDQKGESGVKEDVDLSADDLKNLANRYKEIYKSETHEDFPDDPNIQLTMAINAVFNSWNSARAVKYRQISNIS